MGEGPWAFDEVADLIDFAGDAAWHGGPKPDPLPPAANPGGLVAAVIDSEGRLYGRWPLTRHAPLEGIDEAAGLVSGSPGRRLVIYDGDSGQPVLSAMAG